MTYQQSIRAITIAEAHYNTVCDRSDTDAAVEAALAILWQSKARHRELFGQVRRVGGEWV